LAAACEPRKSQNVHRMPMYADQLLMSRRPRRIAPTAAIFRSVLHHVSQPEENLHTKLTHEKSPCRCNSSTAEAPPSSEAQSSVNDEAGGVSNVPRRKGSPWKFPTSRSQTNELDGVFGKTWASRAESIEMDLNKLTNDLQKHFKRGRKLRHVLDSNHPVSLSCVTPISHSQRWSCIDRM
jgi:hypothetical protein